MADLDYFRKRFATFKTIEEEEELRKKKNPLDYFSQKVITPVDDTPEYAGAKVDEWKIDEVAKAYKYAIEQSDNPLEMEDRFNTAYYLAKSKGMSFTEAFENMESILQADYGKALTPKSGLEAVMNVWKAQTVNREISKYTYELKNKALSGQFQTMDEVMSDPLYQQVKLLEYQLPPEDMIKRDWPVNALKSVMQIIPSWTENLAKGATVGMLAQMGTMALMGAAKGAVAGSVALPGAGTIAGAAGGALVAVVPTIAKLAGSTFAAVAVAKNTQESEGGAAFYDMITFRDPITGQSQNPLVAARWATVYEGLAAAVEMSEADAFFAPMRHGINAAQIRAVRESVTASMKSVSDASARAGILLKIAHTTAGKWFLEWGEKVASESMEEGIQEGLQIWATESAKLMTNRLDGTSISPASKEEIVKRISDTIIGSVIGMGLLQLGPASFSVWADTKAAKSYAQYSAQQKPKVDITEQKRQPPKMETIREPERAARFEEQVNAKLPEGLKYQVTDEKGAEQSILKVGDSQGNRLNYVRYEPVVDEESNTIRIINLETTENPNIAKALLGELASRYPGWNIEWNPQLENEKILKEYIELQNPRGKAAGLQFFETEYEVPEYRGMEYLKQRIASRRPDFGTPEALDTISFTASRWAAKLGISPDEFVDKVLAPEIFTEIPEMRASNAAGASIRVKLEDSIKTLIDLAPRANPSTMTHELTHAVVWFAQSHKNTPQIASFLVEIETALGVKNGDWNAEFKGWTDEYKKGNRTYMEALAYALEDYVTTGNAPNEEVKPILQRLAEWIYDIYKGLKAARVNMTPELKEYFDNWTKGEAPIVAEQMESTPSEEVLYQGQEAYHGSAAEFDKFDSTYMGSGEGAQDFGWGHYLTTNEVIARGYAVRSASNTPNEFIIGNKKYISNLDGTYKNRSGETSTLPEAYALEAIQHAKFFKNYDKTKEGLQEQKEKAIQYLQQTIKREVVLPILEGGTTEDLQEAIKILKENDVRELPKRKLYTAEINPEGDDVWIDWEEPIGEENYNKIISQIEKERPDLIDNSTVANMITVDIDGEQDIMSASDLGLEDGKQYTRGEWVKALSDSGFSTKYISILEFDMQYGFNEYSNGRNVYTTISNTLDPTGMFGGDKDASLFLDRAGITGIRYPAASLGMGDGSKGTNFVVFDDNKIKIEDRTLFQDDRTDSPAFREWFGDSKVVDGEGKPLVVYHGSDSENIESFDIKKALSSNDYGLRGRGFYFSTNKKTADNYGPITYQSYLSIRNPFNPLTFNSKEEIASKLNIDDGIFEFTKDKKFKVYSQYSSTLTSALKEAGYDGVIYQEGQEIIAFSPTQIKSIYNRGTWDINDPRILFQDDIKSTAKAMYEEGKSWEELMEFYETPFMDDDRAAYGVDDLSESEKREWYKDQWQKAATPEETTPDLQSWVVSLADDDYTPLKKYLEDVYNGILKMENATVPLGADGDEARDIVGQIENARRLSNIVAGPIKAGALSLGNMRVLSKKFLNILHGIIKKNPEEYARIFGDLAGDEKLATMGRIAEQGKYADIADPELEQRMTISQKSEKAQVIRDEQIAKKVLSNEATDEEVQSYAKKKEQELKDLKKREKELEIELKVSKIELGDQENTIIEQSEALRDVEKELDKITARMEEYLASSERIPEALETQKRRIEIQRETIRKRLTEAGDWRELERQLSNAKDRERYYSSKIEESVARAGQSDTKDVRARSMAREQIRTIEAKLSASKGFKNSSQLQTYLAKMEERTKIKDEVRLTEAENRVARELRAYRESLVKQVSRSPYILDPPDQKGKSRTIHFSYAQQIADIQKGFNKEYLSDKTQENINAIRDRVINNPDILVGMDKTLLKRVMGKNLNEFTLAELEDMATTIRLLREQGSALYDQVREQERIRIESLIGLTSFELKSQPQYEPKTGFDSKKAPGEAVKQKLQKGLFEVAYDSHRFAQYILDGGERGENSKLLDDKVRELTRRELENKERRFEAFQKALRESGRTEKELSERFTFKGAGAEGGDVILTRDELIGMALALRDQNSGRRAIFGTLFSVEEGQRYKNQPEVLYDLADQRLAIILQGIDTILDDKDKVIMDAYAADAKEAGPRLAEATAKAENRLMEIVDNYFGIFIKGVTGKSIDEELGIDQLSRIPGQRRGPDKSRTIARIELDPASVAGKPMELSVRKVHTLGVVKTEHYMAFAEHAKVLTNVYKGSALFRERLAQTHGDAAVSALDAIITEIINPELITMMNKNDTILKMLRGNLSIAYLGFRLSSVLKQLITSPWPAFQEVGFGLFPVAMRSMVNPIGFTKKAEARSTILRNRTMDMIIEYMKHTVGESKFTEIQKSIGAFGMKGLELVDRYSVAIGWQAMYEKVLRETNDESKAIDEADRMVQLIQPSSTGYDNAPMYQTKNEYMKVVLQFTQQLNVVFRNIYLDAPQDIKGAMRKDLPKSVRIKHFEHLLGIMVSYAIAGGLLTAMITRPKDDPEEEKKRLAWGLTTQFTESLPFIGEEISQIMQYAFTGEKSMQYGDSLIPGFSKFVQGTMKLSQGDIEVGIYRTLEGAGMMGGVPTSAIKGATRVLKGDFEGLLGRPKR